MNAFLYLTTVLIWGTTWIAIALQAGDVAPMVSVFYRFVLAAGVLMVGLLLTRKLKPLAGRDHLFCLLQGMCVFCFNFLCFYTAVAYISSGLESVIFSMATLFNAINGVIFLKQQVTRKLMLANLLGLVGMISLFWRDIQQDGFGGEVLLGVGLCLLGTYGFSLGNMISARHQRRGLDVFSTNAWAMSYGAVTMLMVILLSGTEFGFEATASYVSALLYLAIFGSVIGFGSYFLLIGRVGTGPAAYATVMFPLVALSVSTVFEGYQWSLSAVVGLLLILLGNAVMFVKRWPGQRVAVAVN
ncbi:DMT family transporter [Oceanobacter mangrovi]|uniref:DMT family transporter n=1 Tax=Oceanobacter mangrovi TaxID=2862510 RepID=UPI001C8DEE0D|nr:DMT family transporter [Oceanobacter mangrovi]